MKLKANNDAKQLKIEALTQVARLAFDGELEQRVDEIPYIIIPGNKPKFRCCVYKEREVVRERVHAARGKLAFGNAQDALITVLPAACEGCPINRYTVTENCQKCLAKKCINVCPFGAISMTGKGAFIDQEKCRECGKCASACPYNAISDTLRPCLRSCQVNAISMNEHKQAVINEQKCISCGACTNDCPFGAITDISYIVEVIEAIQSDKEVYALFAPAIEGQFGKANVAMLKRAFKELGFYDSFETAMGADAVALHESEELLERIKQGKRMTTSCCPAFVELIRKQYPKAYPLVSGTVSPMTAAARWIKHHHPDSVVVFIGPCVAKKAEVKYTEDSADYVITFDELEALFIAKDIDPEKYEAAYEQDASVFGKNFALSGGVSAAVLRALKEKGVEQEIVCGKCSGVAECKKTVALLNAGKVDEVLIEGMACEGGCVAGPAVLVSPRQGKKLREKVIEPSDQRSIAENVQKLDFSEVSLESNRSK